MSFLFVSLVIPCFNAERYLSEALESCLNQTHQDFEIICVNDGSTDSTGEILEKYSQKHPTKIRVFTTPNQGVSHARNLGTAKASADWLQYLDADDLLLPESLQKKVQAVCERPEVGVVYTGWQKMILKKGAFKRGEVVCKKIEDLNLDQEIALFKNFWAPTAAYLYCKSMVKKIGGWNLNLPIIQDARFTLEFALHKAQFFYIPEVLCLYRSGHENVLSSRKAAFARDCFRNAEDIERIWKGTKLTSERLNALVEVYFYVARSAYSLDRDLFHLALDRLKHLDRNYIRFAPRPLKWAANIVGYEKAEAIAQKWREIKEISNLCPEDHRKRGANEA